MKAVIFTEGGKEKGFGHITRCISLYQAFKEKALIPEFIINGDDSIADLLEGVNYKNYDWLRHKGDMFNAINDADIVIVDSYLASLDTYNEISKIAKMLVCIDDNKRLDYPADIIVNGSIYAPGLDYNFSENKRYLLGTEYLPQRKEFWDVPQKKASQEIKKVLVTFGGIARSDTLYKILEEIKDQFNFEFYIVDPVKKKITAEELISLMLESDICISGGGQTLYELARVGVPAISICFADNQRSNLEAWHKKGFSEFPGQDSDAGLKKKIVDAVEKLSPYDERAKRMDIGRKYVDGKGSQRIVEEILKK